MIKVKWLINEIIRPAPDFIKGFPCDRDQEAINALASVREALRKKKEEVKRLINNISLALTDFMKRFFLVEPWWHASALANDQKNRK